MADGKEREMNLDTFTENFQSVVIKDAMEGFESLGLQLDEETVAALFGGNE